MSTPPEPPIVNKESRSTSFRWSRAIALGTCAFLVAGAVLYYMYISTQESYLVNRNFRLLAMWSNVVTKTLSSYETVFKNVLHGGGETTFYPTNNRSQYHPYAEKLALCPDKVSLRQPEQSTQTEQSTQSTKYLKAVQSALCDVDRLEEVQVGSVQDFLPDQANGDKPSLSHSGLSISASPEKDLPDFVLSYTDTSQKPIHIHAKIPIASFMEEVTKDTAFDDIILARKDGVIVYQKNPTQFQWADLHVLMDNTVSDAWFPFFSSENANQSTSPPASSVGLPSSSTRHIPTPALLTVEPAGVSFKMFSQPVIIPGQSNSSDQWILCGLISSSSFRDRYLKIPFTYLMVLVFILLCAILGLPLLRLWIMAPEERLRRFHVWTLLITSVIGTALLTFFLLDAYTFLSTKSRQSHQLRLTAQTIHDSFREELHRILYQLRVYDWSLDYQQDLQKVAPQNPKIYLPDRYGPVAETQRPNPCEHFPVLQDDTPEPWRNFDSKHPPPCYAPYDLVFWMNAQGVLDINWTRGQAPGVKGFLPLKAREYVRRVRNETLPLWHTQFPGTKESYDFYIQPIISWTTGWNSVVVSIPSHQKEGSGETKAAKPRIAALETRLTSLMNRPILPPETGFAIIQDEDGLVLFHSEQKRNLRENFFLETDENRKLQGYVFARRSGDFEGRYWGTDHQFHVHPIQDTPWSLVVFKGKNPLRTMNFEMLLFAGALFTIYAVIVGGIFGFLAARGLRHGHATWIWPTAVHRKQYLAIAIGNSLWVALGCLLYRFGGFEPGTVILLIILSPFLWCGLLSGLSRRVLRFPSASSPPSTLSRWNVHTSYAAMTTTFLMVFAAFPAAVIFHIVHNAETTLLIEQEQLGLMRALTPEDRIPTFQYYPNWSDQYGSDICDEPKVTWWSLNGVYPQPLPCTILTTHIPAPSPPVNSSWFTTFHKWFRSRALYGPEALKTWGLIPTGTQNAYFTWAAPENDQATTIVLHTSRFPYRIKDLPAAPHRVTTKRTTLAIQSGHPLPPWALMSFTPPFSPLYSEPLLIGIPIFAAILFLFPRFILRRILFIPEALTPPVGSNFLPKNEAISNQHRLLLIGIPGSGKSRWAAKMENSDRVNVVDIWKESAKTNWVSSVLEDIKTHLPLLVIVDHFEHKLGSTEIDREKAVLLNNLLRMNLSICVLSNVNPTQSSLIRRIPVSQEVDLPENPVTLGMPWAEIFHTFSTMYFFDAGEKAILEDALMKDSRQDLSNLPPGRRMALTETFLEECGPNDTLRTLGQWVRTQERWKGFTPDQLVSEILLLANNYYRAIWQTCSREEKYALFHLAQDRFLHVRHPGLQQLIQKGLVRLNPDLRLMNQSFRQFVVRIGQQERLEEREQAETASTWNLIKWPLLLILGVFVIALMATQQQFRTSVITLVSLLPILLPAMPDLPGFIHNDKIRD